MGKGLGRGAEKARRINFKPRAFRGSSGDADDDGRCGCLVRASVERHNLSGDAPSTSNVETRTEKDEAQREHAEKKKRRKYRERRLYTDDLERVEMGYIESVNDLAACICSLVNTVTVSRMSSAGVDDPVANSVLAQLREQSEVLHPYLDTSEMSRHTGLKASVARVVTNPHDEYDLFMLLKTVQSNLLEKRDQLGSLQERCSRRQRELEEDMHLTPALAASISSAITHGKLRKMADIDTLEGRQDLDKEVLETVSRLTRSSSTNNRFFKGASDFAEGDEVEEGARRPSEPTIKENEDGGESEGEDDQSSSPKATAEEPSGSMGEIVPFDEELQIRKSRLFPSATQSRRSSLTGLGKPGESEAPAPALALDDIDAEDAEEDPLFDVRHVVHLFSAFVGRLQEGTMWDSEQWQHRLEALREATRPQSPEPAKPLAPSAAHTPPEFELPGLSRRTSLAGSEELDEGAELRGERGLLGEHGEGDGEEEEGKLSRQDTIVVVTIQAHFRGFRARRWFRILRSACVLVQTHWRGYQVRKWYEAVKRSGTVRTVTRALGGLPSLGSGKNRRKLSVTGSLNIRSTRDVVVDEGPPAGGKATMRRLRSFPPKGETHTGPEEIHMEINWGDDILREWGSKLVSGQGTQLFMDEQGAAWVTDGTGKFVDSSGGVWEADGNGTLRDGSGRKREGLTLQPLDGADSEAAVAALERARQGAASSSSSRRRDSKNKEGGRRDRKQQEREEREAARAARAAAEARAEAEARRADEEARALRKARAAEAEADERAAAEARKLEAAKAEAASVAAAGGVSPAGSARSHAEAADSYMRIGASTARRGAAPASAADPEPSTASARDRPAGPSSRGGGAPGLLIVPGLKPPGRARRLVPSAADPDPAHSGSVEIKFRFEMRGGGDSGAGVVVSPGVKAKGGVWGRVRRGAGAGGTGRAGGAAKADSDLALTAGGRAGDWSPSPTRIANPVFKMEASPPPSLRSGSNSARSSFAGGEGPPFGREEGEHDGGAGRHPRGGTQRQGGGGSSGASGRSVGGADEGGNRAGRSGRGAAGWYSPSTKPGQGVRISLPIHTNPTRQPRGERGGAGGGGSGGGGLTLRTGSGNGGGGGSSGGGGGLALRSGGSGRRLFRSVADNPLADMGGDTPEMSPRGSLDGLPFGLRGNITPPAPVRREVERDESGQK